LGGETAFSSFPGVAGSATGTRSRAASVSGVAGGAVVACAWSGRFWVGTPSGANI